MSDRITVAAVGDVMLQHSLSQTLLTDPRSPITLLREADVFFANLELPLTVRGAPADKPVALRGEPERADDLIEMGNGVWSTANNHTLDCGVEGLLDTISVLTDNDIPFSGSGDDLDAALRPAIVGVGGITIAQLGFCSALPPGSAATPIRPGLAPIRVRQSYVVDAVLAEEQPGTSPYVLTEVMPQDLELAGAAVRDARKKSDLVVISLHWGVPKGWVPDFQWPLADYQRPLAHALIDAGAGLILGHHPHVTHGVERYGGAFILYSLGNFIFHPYEREERVYWERPGPPYNRKAFRTIEHKRSYVALFELGGPVVESLRLVPLVLDDGGEPAIAAGEAKREILERTARYSQDLCPEFSLDDDGLCAFAQQGHGG